MSLICRIKRNLNPFKGKATFVCSTINSYEELVASKHRGLCVCFVTTNHLPSYLLPNHFLERPSLATPFQDQIAKLFLRCFLSLGAYTHERMPCKMRSQWTTRNNYCQKLF